jgi:hypothetical protein
MSKLLNCCFKGFLVLLPLGLISYIEYSFYADGRSVACTVVNVFLILMLLWSLAATYFTDPGYTKNYIRS